MRRHARVDFQLFSQKSSGNWHPWFCYVMGQFSFSPKPYPNPNGIRDPNSLAVHLRLSPFYHYSSCTWLLRMHMDGFSQNLKYWLDMDLGDVWIVRALLPLLFHVELKCFMLVLLMLTISCVFCATGTSRRTKKRNLTYSTGLGGGNSKSKKSLWLSDDDFDVVEGSSDEEDNPAHLSGRIFQCSPWQPSG